MPRVYGCSRPDTLLDPEQQRGVLVTITAQSGWAMFAYRGAGMLQPARAGAVGLHKGLPS